MASASFNSASLCLRDPFPSCWHQSNQRKQNPSRIPLPSQFRSKSCTAIRARYQLRFKVSAMRDSRARGVSKDSWESLILKSELPVLVEFHASWCGPCRMVHRLIDEIALEYAGKLHCFVLNTDNDLQIAEDYDIKAVPVVLLFKDGVKCESVVGTMPKEFYVAAIERVLKM